MVLDDLTALHALVCVQTLSMMGEALPVGVRGEIRVSKAALVSALFWDT